jgi:hypothetical protein
MKELIQKSLDGLNQTGRIELEKSNIDEKSQIDFDHISNTIST